VNGLKIHVYIHNYKSGDINALGIILVYYYRMPRICQFENCRKVASYALTYCKPDRCKEHKEDRKPQYAICMCGKARTTYNDPGATRGICCASCKTPTMIDVMNTKCACGKQPNFNEPGTTRGICCISCKTPTMINVVNTKCACGKQPVYNEPGTTRGICCISCKTPTMIDVVSKKCACGKQPVYNEPGETGGICCASCKTPTMIDVRSRLCACGKYPSYNEPGETGSICCASCKTPTMINVKDRKCACGTHPSYNEPGETGGICCASCKTPTMINVVSRKCACGKCSRYNEPGEAVGICCASCKTPTMIDVVSKKCACGKQPAYNEPGETGGICCASCKTPTMINVKSRKCACGKHPHYNEPGETGGICCASCKTPTMINVVDKTCKGQDGTCTTLANAKYKNYCAFCFSNMFPTDPLTYQIRSKTKEIATRDFINDHFEGFSHDKPIHTDHCDCSIRRRIDHRKLIGNTMLAIETDENAHKSYDAMDEEIRYDDLYNAFSGKWIYIRFNPDKFRNKAGVSKNPTIATRLIELKTEIERQIQRIEAEENTELLEIKYMYYDGYA
jgi:hypothetical protein